MKRVAYIILASLAMQACLQKEINQTLNQKNIGFNPPFKNLSQTFDIFEVDSKKETIIKRANGTKIKIPKDAFLDQFGEVIHGIVTIQYRDFNDAIDVFLAGIPMEYKLDNKTEHFETAGMFEIKGEQNGNPISINPNNPIQIDIPSQNTDNDFRVFKINGEKKWQYAGEGTVSIKTSTSSRGSQEMKTTPFPLTKNYFVMSYWSVADIIFRKPTKSSPLVKKKMTEYGFSKFDFYNRTPIEFGGREYPADLVLWELIGNKIPKKFQKKVRSKITKVSGNKYKIELSKYGKEKKAFTTYANAIIPLEHLFKFSPDEWKSKYKTYLEKLKEEKNRVQMEQAAIRSLKIDDFGIYNWDRFVKFDSHVKIIADYNFKDQEDELFGTTIYCILKNDKALVKLQYQDRLILTPEEPAKLFAILPGNKLWVYPFSQFSEIDFETMKLQTNPKHHFNFKEIKEIKNENEFRKLIEA